MPESNLGNTNQFLRVVLCVALAILFTGLQLYHSLHYGRLALPITYDDVSYFVDAQQRLDQMTQGVVPFARGYIERPPHSPVSLLLAAAGFSLLGYKDWAPATMNGLIVLGLLLFIYYRTRDLPFWVWLLLSLFALTWPIVGHAVVEFRPDILCAFTTVCALVIITDPTWIRGRARDHYLAGLCIGLAFLAKPSISPITLSVVGVALLVGAWQELRLFPSATKKSLVNQSWKRCLLTAAVVVAPHYIVALPQIVSYIYTNSLGKDAHLWQLHAAMFYQLTFYLTGPAGQAIMGNWLWLWLISLAAASVVAAQMRDRPAWYHARALTVVGLTVYLVVSLPKYKGALLGVLFHSFLLLTSIELLAYILRQERLPSSTGIVKRMRLVPAMLVLAGIAMYQFPWHYKVNTPPDLIPSAEQIRFYRQAVETITGRFAIDTRPRVLAFLTGIPDYFNSQTLTYYLLKQGIRTVTIRDIHRENDLARFAASIREADYVIAFTPDYSELVRYLPSTHIQRQIRELIDADPGLKLVTSVVNNVHGGSILLFERDNRGTVRPLSFMESRHNEIRSRSHEDP